MQSVSPAKLSAVFSLTPLPSALLMLQYRHPSVRQIPIEKFHKVADLVCQTLLLKRVKSVNSLSQQKSNSLIPFLSSFGLVIRISSLKDIRVRQSPKNVEVRGNSIFFVAAPTVSAQAPSESCSHLSTFFHTCSFVHPAWLPQTHPLSFTLYTRSLQ